jgi:hypothetical protein
MLALYHLSQSASLVVFECPIVIPSFIPFQRVTPSSTQLLKSEIR